MGDAAGTAVHPPMPIPDGWPSTLLGVPLHLVPLLWLGYEMLLRLDVARGDVHPWSWLYGDCPRLVFQARPRALQRVAETLLPSSSAVSTTGPAWKCRDSLRLVYCPGLLPQRRCCCFSPLPH